MACMTNMACVAYMASFQDRFLVASEMLLRGANALPATCLEPKWLEPKWLQIDYLLVYYITFTVGPFICAIDRRHR